MDIRKTRLKIRRVFRKRRKQAVAVGELTESSFERYIIKRLVRIIDVKRFVIGWTALIVLLIAAVFMQTRGLTEYYQQVAPASGGTIREGVVGTFTNANPLFAQNNVDTAVSRLVFSGLMKYDQSGNVVPDLADRVEIDETETVYTVVLKENLVWQDGAPLTATDVVYTFQSIQNPDIKSYLASSWRNIQVREIDAKTVSFTLPTALSGFQQSLITGIIPQHVLKDVAPAQLRSSSFNNELPIGSGPFSFQAVEVDGLGDKKSERLALAANTRYHHGTPKIERVILRTFSEADALVRAFNNRQVDTMSGLTSVPEDVDMEQAEQYDIPITSQVMTFFKTTQEQLKDANVRKALALGVNKKEIFDNLGYPLINVDQPFLRSQVGYDKNYAQATNNAQEANKLLDEAGWVKSPVDGTRSKDGKKLEFKLYSAATSEFTSVAGILQNQWKNIGVDVEVVLQSDEELQATVAAHNYDALLYGISVGSDPDVYPYWHSSQFDPSSATRLNLSEYSSPAADRALEAGRTRSDQNLRNVKYRPFLEAWRNDTPAVGLYQPRFLYITSESLQGITAKTVHSPADRYSNVHEWTVRRAAQNQ